MGDAPLVFRARNECRAAGMGTWVLTVWQWTPPFVLSVVIGWGVGTETDASAADQARPSPTIFYHSG